MIIISRVSRKSGAQHEELFGSKPYKELIANLEARPIRAQLKYRDLISGPVSRNAFLSGSAYAPDAVIRGIVAAQAHPHREQLVAWIERADGMADRVSLTLAEAQQAMDNFVNVWAYDHGFFQQLPVVRMGVQRVISTYTEQHRRDLTMGPRAVGLECLDVHLRRIKADAANLVTL